MPSEARALQDPPQAPIGGRTLAAVSARDVSKVYGDGQGRVVAVDNVSIAFGQGSFTAIMGPSGSGKSTLMHCLAGLDTVDQGSIEIGGREITTLRDRQVTELRRDHIGFIFQSFNLLPTLTARQNIVLPIELAGKKIDKSRLDFAARRLGIEGRLDHLPSQLSGGQQQRVAIARALITSPDVIFADEPTGALDTRSGQNLLDILRTASREGGQTIVMVTHDPIAATYADRVVLLSDGQLVGQIEKPTSDDVLDAMRGLGA
ncbi:putative ABC transport system ATP-binding protein [Antricoccus suffuscus]|uniref:Putative ABC transport system ATP-binding protein n=1 Tax=Antricoccus suffuscus TaxID=1629062 RepID=A0A2T0ZYR5_9ACTN|nr:ABC transporter ATP-binding protein [Antricoccus suffuscus]PRZ41495.1 putative ABC transport system ATP-binding protein [Antricoccus suffuscus]